MLRLRGGGVPQFARVSGEDPTLGGPSRTSEPWSLEPPRGGRNAPPARGLPGVCSGVTWGGVQRRPRPNSRRGGDISPLGRTDGRDARTRLRRLMGAPRARGRPARALPHGPSPRPDRPPCAPAPALGHRGFGGGKPRASPLRKGEVQGLASGPQFAEAASGPRFGASLPLPPPWRERGPGRGRQVAGGGGPGQLSHGGRGRRSGEEGRRGGAAVPEQALLFSLKGKFCRGSRGLYAVGAGRDSRPAGSRWGRGVGMEPAGPGRRGSPAPVARVVAAPSPAAPVTPVASVVTLSVSAGRVVAGNVRRARFTVRANVGLHILVRLTERSVACSVGA